MSRRPFTTLSIFPFVCISFLSAGLMGCSGVPPALTNTVQVASVTVPEGSVLPVPVMATGSANGSVVTFGVTGTATGGFSPATCTIANGSCSVSYVPTGSLVAGTYAGAVNASFAATGSYLAQSATSTLTINANPTFTFNLLASLTGTSGADPGADPTYGNLIQGSDGNFYGVTFAGEFLSPRGTSGYGTAFKITPSGSFTLLHAFAGGPSDGANPEGSLVEGSDGNFYGVTYKGGTNGIGALYRMTPSGTVTLLHSFTGAASDGGSPSAGLIQGSDGSFYGTAQTGGAFTYGTVYKITSSGGFTLLYSFPPLTTGGSFTSQGGLPSGSLVEGSDGNFYGMAGFGGANGWGTIYQITPSGSFTVLHTFTGAVDGQTPFGSLVQGSDGRFYGMTVAGGPGGAGTVFAITASGSFALLHSFAGGTGDGGKPYGSLIEGSDGNFYGMTESGGGANFGYGTVFTMTQSGSVTVLHSFTNGTTTDGEEPSGNLVQGSDGNFYGMTSRGGASSEGTIFKLVAGPPLPAPVSLSVPAIVTHGTAFTLGYANVKAANTAGVTVAGPTTQQTCVATNYLASDMTDTPVDTIGWVGAKTVATTATNVSLTAPATPGKYTYVLTCGGAESGFATMNVQ